jgi:hypothetical protein
MRNIFSGSVPGFSRSVRWRKRFQRFKLRIVGIVAVDAEQVLLITIPIAGSFAVDTDLPVAEFIAMALAAEPIRLRKINQFT